jgi:cell division transport system permease protein
MARKKRTKKQPSALPSIVSMALVMYLLSMLALVVFNADKLSNELKESMSFRVFFTEKADETLVLNTQLKLEEDDYYKDINFISKEEASKEISEEYGHDFVQTLGFYPIYHSLEIVLKAEYADDATVKNLVLDIEQMQGVLEVNYQEDFLKNLNDNLRLIGMILLGLSLVFSIVAAGLINSTIRLNLFARRFIIKSMQLVGATEWFIIKPLIGKFILYAVYAIVFSVGLSGFTVWLLFNLFPDLAVFYDINLFVLIFCLILAFGMGVVAMSTYFSTKKYLKINLDELY